MLLGVVLESIDDEKREPLFAQRSIQYTKPVLNLGVRSHVIKIVRCGAKQRHVLRARARVDRKCNAELEQQGGGGTVFKFGGGKAAAQLLQRFHRLFAVVSVGWSLMQ